MPSTTSTMHSLHFPCLRQEVGTSMPRSSANSKSDRASVPSIVCPLMVRVTAMGGVWLPALCFEFGFHGFSNLLCGAFALFFFGPLPLGQVIVGTLKAALGGKNIDLLHELVVEHDSDVVHVVLSFDLGGDFLPIKDLVVGHGWLYLFREAHKEIDRGGCVGAVTVGADFVSEHLADGRAADCHLDVGKAGRFKAIDDGLHIHHRGCEQGAHANDGGLAFFGGGHELLHTLIDADVVQFEARAFGHHANEIFPDVVEIAADGAHEENAFGFDGTVFGGE